MSTKLNRISTATGLFTMVEQDLKLCLNFELQNKINIEELHIVVDSIVRSYAVFRYYESETVSKHYTLFLDELIDEKTLNELWEIDIDKVASTMVENANKILDFFKNTEGNAWRQ